MANRKKQSRPKPARNRPQARYSEHQAERPGDFHPNIESPDPLLDALDRLDTQIRDAVSERARLTEEIGRLRRQSGQASYEPQRDAEIIENAVLRYVGPLGGETIRAVFREIVSGCRALEAPMRIAYLGPEFTFSHLAAIERFGQSAELVPVGTIAAVFEEVERGQAQFGVVPMENSTDGRVSDTLECFSRSQVRICGELPLRIHHCLLGIGPREKVATVYSKPQPLSQCRNWLARHLPNASLVEVASTGEAAKRAKGDPCSAAVASAQAGVNYGLPTLVANIEDNLDNVTRFAVISQSAGLPTGNDKTSLMMEIAHLPGALADTLAILKRNQLNMSWIESFPIPRHRGRYLFFLEFEAHESDPPARRALATLRKKALRLEVLGSYARTEPIG
jgi:chorismate mutase / prephenate dehydratase